MAAINKYQTIFFDLDHTLWDYDRNSLETLADIHKDYRLYDHYGVTMNKFVDTFKVVNDSLWEQYNRGQLDRNYIKTERFSQILKKVKADISQSNSMSEDYLFNCPKKTNTLPFTHEVLEELSGPYNLYILTNGFNDVQQLKLERSGLKPYFKGMITSECCGYRKPDVEIFDYSLKLANTTSSASLMIGDNLDTDIRGAMRSNIDAVYYNPSKLSHSKDVTYEINCLSQLTDIL